MKIDQNELKKQKKTMALYEIASTRTPKGFNIARTVLFIENAHTSAWYNQAKIWAEQPPRGLDEKTEEGWKIACQFIVYIVDIGYNEHMQGWWTIRSDEAERKILYLMAFGATIKDFKRQSTKSVPVGYREFVEIICGYDWENRFFEIQRNIRMLKDAKNKQERNGNNGNSNVSGVNGQVGQRGI